MSKIKHQRIIRIPLKNLQANLDTAYYLNEKDITRCKTDSLFVDVDKFLKTKSTYDDLVSLIDAMANETPS